MRKLHEAQSKEIKRVLEWYRTSLNCLFLKTFLDFDSSCYVSVLLDPICYACYSWGLWIGWHCPSGTYCAHSIFCKGLFKQLLILESVNTTFSPDLSNLEPHDICNDQRRCEYQKVLRNLFDLRRTILVSSGFCQISTRKASKIF